jgi:SEC-C motif-containing protein
LDDGSILRESCYLLEIIYIIRDYFFEIGKVFMAKCPCGGKQYNECCGRFLEGKQLPATALELMRSRYTAYVIGNMDYVRDTWLNPPEDLEVGATQWLGLQVKAYLPIDGTHAEVEFVARYKAGQSVQRLHERSSFIFAEGRWLYVDGKILTK